MDVKTREYVQGGVRNQSNRPEQRPEWKYPCLSAHQPNYLPWLGYFDKMAAADRFVLADDVQYSTNSYTNRTRIKTAEGTQWLTVPVLSRGRGHQLIREIRIDNSRNWRRKHLRTIQVNYRNTPYYDWFFPLIDQLYLKNWSFLSDLNVAAIECMCRHLHIDTPRYISSELNLVPKKSTYHILDMAGRLKCKSYLSGRGASLSYLREDLFRRAGVDLEFNDFIHPVYPQQFGTFEPNLSVIDLLFNAGPACRELFRQDRFGENRS